MQKHRRRCTRCLSESISNRTSQSLPTSRPTSLSWKAAAPLHQAQAPASPLLLQPPTQPCAGPRRVQARRRTTTAQFQRSPVICPQLPLSSASSPPSTKASVSPTNRPAQLESACTARITRRTSRQASRRSRRLGQCPKCSRPPRSTSITRPAASPRLPFLPTAAITAFQ